MSALSTRPRAKLLAIARYYRIAGAAALGSEALSRLILEYAEVKAKLWNGSLGVYDRPFGYVPPGHPDDLRRDL